MTITATKPEKADVAKQPQKLSRLDAAQAVLDQAVADAAEAAETFQRLSDQHAAYEARVRQGDRTAEAGQLVELTGLLRFAELRNEAAAEEVQLAINKLTAADAHRTVARINEYHRTTGVAFNNAFWQAVEFLGQVYRGELERVQQARLFADQLERARAAFVAAGDTGGIEVLANTPNIETSFYDIGITGIAIRAAFAADSSALAHGHMHRAVKVPADVRLEHFPTLNAARPEQVK